MKKNILCITDTLNDFKAITKGYNVYFFPIKQLTPSEHCFSLFESAFKKLSKQLDLSQIDLIFAEYIESLPILYFIRRAGYYCPAILIPHTNAYPLPILIYFILLKCYMHKEDLILCGSEQAAFAYKKIININARNIATFGIKSDFKPLNQVLCRKELQLIMDKKILLYTGRFMNDKGLETLLSIYSSLLKQQKNVQLIISTSHIDPIYYNTLAPYTKDVIIFYRLARDKLVKLYNAADVYISCALSIFETYGKSPLEAIACGTPVIVPAWDGFPYYITSEHGYLINVNFENTFVSPYQFATIDKRDCIEKINSVLKDDYRVESILPSWAYYDYSLQQIRNLIKTIFANSASKKFNNLVDKDNDKIDQSIFSSGINEFFKCYEINTLKDLILKSNAGIFSNKFYQRQEKVLKRLHHEIFSLMKTCQKKLDKVQKIEVNFNL